MKKTLIALLALLAPLTANAQSSFVETPIGTMQTSDLVGSQYTYMENGKLVFANPVSECPRRLAGVPGFDEANVQSTSTQKWQAYMMTAMKINLGSTDFDHSIAYTNRATGDADIAVPDSSIYESAGKENRPTMLIVDSDGNAIFSSVNDNNWPLVEGYGPLNTGKNWLQPNISRGTTGTLRMKRVGNTITASVDGKGKSYSVNSGAVTLYVGISCMDYYQSQSKLAYADWVGSFVIESFDGQALDSTNFNEDSDGDGITNIQDNCPTKYNPSQTTFNDLNFLGYEDYYTGKGIWCDCDAQWITLSVIAGNHPWYILNDLYGDGLDRFNRGLDIMPTAFWTCSQPD